MEDNYRHKGLRRQLVGVLKEKGIQNERILEAMLELPRHFFFEKAFEEWAYTDKAFPIGNEQTISQPYTVAYQTELLAIQKGDKILEIGTGSGYQAAILGLLGAKVFSIERQEDLYKKSSTLLSDLKIPNVKTFFGDGHEGLSKHAPFDKILCTAGASTFPNTLFHQLCVGGIMVIPIGDEKAQKMYQITKISDTEFEEKRYDDFLFVPFLKGIVKSA
jgi:protein-L-isoaspartate(D-aspartate) O-methyltransferase